MPLYTYTCDEHGEFAAWARMSDSEAPQPCPTCNVAASRALARPAVGGSGEGAPASAGGGAAPSFGGHSCGAGCVH
jgi:putative FmdB family regulatory protein